MNNILVDTSWVEDNLDNPEIRILECDADPDVYLKGHIPGALPLDHSFDLVDPITSDLISEEDFAVLMGRLGIENTTTVCLYGDDHNLCAFHVYWAMRLFGHDDICILDGGRERWIAEERPLERDTVAVAPTDYVIVMNRQHDLRANRDQVLRHIGNPDRRNPVITRIQGRTVIDDRTPAEFDGVIEPDAGYPIRTRRGGRIPSARNIPFRQILRRDGTLKPRDQLKLIYESNGVTPDSDIICYTRLGERSAATWFALHEILGYPTVRNYDGAWMEWANAVGTPVEGATLAP